MEYLKEMEVNIIVEQILYEEEIRRGQFIRENWGK